MDAIKDVYTFCKSKDHDEDYRYYNYSLGSRAKRPDAVGSATHHFTIDTKCGWW